MPESRRREFGRPASGPARTTALLLALVLGLAGGAHAQGVASITGTVRGEGGAPLAGATIEVGPPASRKSGISGPEGRYRLEGVAPGRALLRARYPGHATLELQVLLAAGQEMRLDLVLTLAPITLEPVRVDADGARIGSDSVAARAPELAVIGRGALDSSPALAELGIGDVARGGAGREPGDPGSILYIRGAGADLKLVYLDGAPVYAPFPLGGLLEPVSQELLNRADVYLGGAPARYDGGLSYVMDLRTRAGSGGGLRVSGAIDLLSSRLLAEGGAGDRVRVLGSVRGIHPFPAAGGLADAIPYGYREGVGRADLLVGRTALLTLTGFSNREQVRIGRSTAADSTVRWGNAAGSIRLRGDLGRTRAELTTSVGEYDATVPLSGHPPLQVTGSARRTRVSADFVREGGVQLRYGASLDG
jgi:hypothetical protein